MKAIGTIIEKLTDITRYIALIAMACMMGFITFAVVSRLFGSPILGDIELVQVGMVVLIMCGLPYTQQAGGHISIGLIVDKFSSKLQKVIDIISELLTAVVTLIIAFIYVEVMLNHKNHMKLSTNLLDIPYYLVDFVIILGFTMRGLQALLKMARRFMSDSKSVV